MKTSRYLIRKINGRWWVHRRGAFLNWSIASFLNWADALAYACRRIDHDRGTQADYALAAGGNLND